MVRTRTEVEVEISHDAIRTCSFNFEDAYPDHEAKQWFLSERFKYFHPFYLSEWEFEGTLDQRVQKCRTDSEISSQRGFSEKIKTLEFSDLATNGSTMKEWPGVK